MRQTALVVLAGTVLGFGAVLCVELRKPTRACRQPNIGLVSPPAPEFLAAQHRSEAKLLLARRVVAERTPLLEAAELFSVVNGEAGIETLMRGVSGRSLREKLCRQVLGYVEGAETDLAREGWSAPGGPHWSSVLRADFEHRLAAGEFPPEAGVE